MPAPRRYRRRGPVYLECTDRLWVDPFDLIRGKLTQARLPLVRAYAPPAATPIEIDALAAHCLTHLTGESWTILPDWLLDRDDAAVALQRLLDVGLVEGEEPGASECGPRAAVATLEDWSLPAALYHYTSRWSGVLARDEVPVDAIGAARAFDASRDAFEQQAQARGVPPTHRPDRGNVKEIIPLPQVGPTAFDTLLAARETHRLFDKDAPMSSVQVAQILHRSFAAHGEAPLGGGLSALRKHSPSGGGMHPVEAYPLLVNVEGLQCGWYHYRACDHSLAPVKALTPEAARGAIERLTAGQTYFASAPLIVALTLRFPRHHWKYPQHARAYRVMLLETGHIGQTFYLAATEAGLGAFFTAAVNDADVDVELGLDGIEEGCVAIVGCGQPSPEGAALRLSSYVNAG